MQVMVVYYSRTDRTKKMAEEIAKGVSEVQGVECSVDGTSYFVIDTCAANEYCNRGACIDDLCPQGLNFCLDGDSANNYRCNGDGSDFIQEEA